MAFTCYCPGRASGIGRAPLSVCGRNSPQVSAPQLMPPPPFVPWQGHAAPILYAVWAEAGFLPEEELLNLRKITSDLDGHPVPVSSPHLEQHRPLSPLPIFQGLWEKGAGCSPRNRWCGKGEEGVEVKTEGCSGGFQGTVFTPSWSLKTSKAF